MAEGSCTSRPQSPTDATRTKRREAVLLVFAAGTSTAQEFKARLSGFFEIGARNNNTGAILTNGTGKLKT